MNNDGDLVQMCDCADVMSSSDGTSNGGSHFVRQTLTSKELSTTLGELNNNGRLCITCSFQRSVYGGCRRAINSRDCKAIVLGPLEQVHQGLSSYYSRCRHVWNFL